MILGYSYKIGTGYLTSGQSYRLFDRDRPNIRPWTAEWCLQVQCV